jgi:hypothetical protein
VIAKDASKTEPLLYGAAGGALPSSASQSRPAAGKPGRVIRFIAFVWKLIAGGALAQSIPTSILVAGWTYRASQRFIFKTWWRNSPLSKTETWEEFALQDRNTATHAHWPNWITGQNRSFWNAFREKGMAAKLKAAWAGLFPSLKINLIVGIQALFNTCILTLPGSSLMCFAWYAGWLNSFNKGYEHAIVGPSLWLSGAFLFVAAMFYLPMAQMRQASTGNWRSFYQFKLIWKLARNSWGSTMGLALLYTALSLPFMVLKILPSFFPQISPALADVTPQEAFHISQRYFFWCGMAFFPVYAALRFAAAKTYASSMLELVQNGNVTEYDLGNEEWITLRRLKSLGVRPQPSRHYLLAAAGWVGSRMGRAVSVVLLAIVWFSFVVQLLVSEFIIRTETGWLNQPLVQFPAFNFTPSRLRDANPNP